MKTGWMLLAFCTVGYLLTFNTFYVYSIEYGIPYGKLDTDNYMTWLDEDRSRIGWLTETRKTLGVDLVHEGFLSTIRFFTNVLGRTHTHTLTYLIPWMLWYLMPLSMYFFAYTVTGNEWISFESMLFLMLGTYLMFFFGVCSVWSQFFSFIFYTFTLGFLVLGLRGFNTIIPLVLAGVLSVVYHPVAGGVYGLMFLGEMIRRRRYIIVLVCVIVAVTASMWMADHGMYIFRGNVPIKEPPLYALLFVFTNPVIVLFAVMGFLLDDSWLKQTFQYYILLLVAVTPFISLMRNIIMVYPFMCLYAVLGYRWVRTRFPHPLILTGLVYLFLLNQFHYVFWYFMRLMIIEMNIHHPEFDRGLPARLIIDRLNDGGGLI